MKVVAIVLVLLAVASANVLPQFLLKKPAEHFVEIAPYIVDGETAQTAAAPYLLSISYSLVEYVHFCAGTIIDKTWFLTAAHCAVNITNGTPVYAGLNDRTQLETAQVRYVDFVSIHKEFTGLPGSEDIALVHVSEPFEYSVDVKPIILPSQNEQFTGETKTYGWGIKQNEDITYAMNLATSTATVMNANECKSTLPKDAPVNNNNICAAVTACYGDGGSPLVVERFGGITEMLGITSWAYVPCGYRNRPTIYTSVSDKINWILQVQWAYYVLQ